MVSEVFAVGVIWADSATVDAQTSFKATIATVIGAIIIAIIGKVTVFDRLGKKSETKEEPKTKLEIELLRQVKYLEGEVRSRDHAIETQDTEITRLRDLCWSHHIDPNVSAKFKTGGSNGNS